MAPLLLLEVRLGEVLHLASEHAPQRAPAACSERQPPEPLLLPSDHLPPPHHPLEHLRQAAFALTPSPSIFLLSVARHAQCWPSCGT